MKSKVLLLCILFTSYYCIAQKTPKGMISIEANVVNVNRMLSNKIFNGAQIDSLIQLGRNYTQVNKDTAFLLIDRAIDWCKDKKEKRWQNSYARALSSKGAAMSKFGYGVDCVEVMLLARTVFEGVENERGMASVDRFLGMHYLNIGDWENASNNLLSSIQIYKDTKTDSRALIGPYEGLSSVYSSLGELNKAQIYLSHAITIVDSTDMTYKEPLLRSQQAELYFRMGKELDLKMDAFPSRKLEFQDSIKKFQRLGLEEALLGLKAAKEMKDPTTRTISQITIASLNNQMSEFNTALTYCEKAQTASLELEDALLSLQTKIQKSIALQGLKRFDEAILVSNSALNSAIVDGASQIQLKAYDLLTSLYVSTDQSDKALGILEKRDKLENIINGMKAKEAVANAEAVHQSAEKEKKILKQKNKILQLASTNASIERKNQLIVGGAFLFACLTFLGFEYDKIRKERNDKIHFTEALIFAQEEERKRIAQDLHDGIGQSLLLIKKQLENTKDAVMSNKILVGETLEEVRAISRDLHPLHLEKVGLSNAIRSIGTKIEISTNIFITQEIDDIDNVLSPKSEIHIFRTIQEAMSNIIKHSEATAANISVTENEDYLHFIIRDNGKGFDHEIAVVTSKSLGLKVMNERISSLGGQLVFKPGKVNGTVIEIKIPKPKS